jgi:Rrf2 family protein
MQLSRAFEYAVLSLTFLARTKDGAASSNTISRVENLSPYFCRNTLQQLKAAGLVKAERGTGYALARPAKEISLREILEAVEGPLALHTCLKKKSTCCRHSTGCKIVREWELIQKRFLADLQKVKLSRIT